MYYQCKLIGKLSLITLLTVSMISCDGSDNDVADVSKDNNVQDISTKKHVAAVSKDIHGYYETVVSADNGDDILLTMLVKPNGEYYGIFNNYLLTSQTYNKEIISLYSGRFATSNTGLTTKVTEFDNAKERAIIRKYDAPANYVSESSIVLDLTNSDSNLDHKSYRLPYANLEEQSLSRFNGVHSNAVSRIDFEYNSVTLNISGIDTHKRDFTMRYNNGCTFKGVIRDKNYQASFYDYNGSFTGKNINRRDGYCHNNKRFTGVTYISNNTLIMIGTDTKRTTEMMVLKPTS